MKSEEYFERCVARHTYFGEDGRQRVKIQEATKDWATRYPQELCAIVKRRRTTDVWQDKWYHLLLPEFFVETYTTRHNYGDNDWFALVGNFEDVRQEQLHTIEANIHG